MDWKDFASTKLATMGRELGAVYWKWMSGFACDNGGCGALLLMEGRRSLFRDPSASGPSEKLLQADIDLTEWPAPAISVIVRTSTYEGTRT